LSWLSLDYGHMGMEAGWGKAQGKIDPGRIGGEGRKRVFIHCVPGGHAVAGFIAWMELLYRKAAN
jgi:hypothetical protein